MNFMDKEILAMVTFKEGMFDKFIICITPLSIDTAFSNRELNAVTKAGDAKLELCSGNKQLLIFDLI